MLASGIDLNNGANYAVTADWWAPQVTASNTTTAHDEYAAHLVKKLEEQEAARRRQIKAEASAGATQHAESEIESSRQIRTSTAVAYETSVDEYAADLVRLHEKQAAEIGLKLKQQDTAREASINAQAAAATHQAEAAAATHHTEAAAAHQAQAAAAAMRQVEVAVAAQEAARSPLQNATKQAEDVVALQQAAKLPWQQARRQAAQAEAAAKQAEAVKQAAADEASRLLVLNRDSEQVRDWDSILAPLTESNPTAATAGRLCAQCSSPVTPGRQLGQSRLHAHTVATEHIAVSRQTVEGSCVGVNCQQSDAAKVTSPLASSLKLFGSPFAQSPEARTSRHATLQSPREYLAGVHPPAQHPEQVIAKSASDTKNITSPQTPSLQLFGGPFSQSPEARSMSRHATMQSPREYLASVHTPRDHIVSQHLPPLAQT